MLVISDEASLRIGSDAESVDLALADPAVSRVHAILEQVGTTWLVRDLGSRNGTRLNGAPVRVDDAALAACGRVSRD